jgi:hypothetical protein
VADRLNACGRCGGDLFFTPGEAPCICAPSLPYDGGSGSSGTATSAERERDRDTRGKTASVQAIVLRLANAGGPEGVTVAEVRGHRGINHHGTASQALSNLEKDGRLVLLAERRGGCHLYVLPRYAVDRERAPRRHRRNDLTDPEVALVNTAEAMLQYADERGAAGKYPSVNLTADTLRALLNLIGRLSA